MSVCTLKGSERIFPPALSLPCLVLRRSPSRFRRGGRSVRRNAALSSKAHRHSSPLVHRAKRRISVFLCLVLSLSFCFPLCYPLPLSFLPPGNSACRSICWKNGRRRGKIRRRSLRDAKRRFSSPRLSDATPINSGAQQTLTSFPHLRGSVRACDSLNSRRDARG